MSTKEWDVDQRIRGIDGQEHPDPMQNGIEWERPSSSNKGQPAPLRWIHTERLDVQDLETRLQAP